MKRRRLLIDAAFTAAGIAITAAQAAAVGVADAATGSFAKDGISRSAASIHQEPVFTASRQRLYQALTDAEQFEKVVQLSEAMKGSPSKLPASISTAQGGAFSLFGGYITGRQVELLTNELIVQAWRAGSWGPGLYSIARFQLIDAGNGSKIIFDHGGFPSEEAEHLAAGWQANYWVPLAKLLSR